MDPVKEEGKMNETPLYPDHPLMNRGWPWSNPAERGFILRRFFRLFGVIMFVAFVVIVVVSFSLLME
jgi:hypothetical protein